MAETFSRLVIRADSPRRRKLLWWSGGVGAFLLLLATFISGMYRGGYQVIDSVRGALAASSRIRQLEAENDDQRRQLEALEVARRVEREGYSEVQKSLGDMQSQIARLNQDLSFYRGLVQPETLIHVKVQQMQIVPQSAPGEYQLKFVLMQTGKPEKDVNGSALLTIDGLQQGKPVSLSFGQVAASHRSYLVYTFKLFQAFDESVTLPRGFEPTRIGVEIHSGHDMAHSFKQAFVWKAQGMSVETDANGTRTDVQSEVVE